MLKIDARIASGNRQGQRDDRADRSDSQQHNEALCAALNEEERAVLVGLLQRIADQQGLLRGVHPGFSTLGKK